MNSSLVHLDLLDDDKVVKRCRAMLKSDGVMVLPGFATEKGLRLIRDEVLGAPFNEATRRFTAWQDQGDPRFAPDHPRNYRFVTRTGFVGRKTLERTPGRIGMGLFGEERFVHFFRKVAGLPSHSPSSVP